MSNATVVRHNGGPQAAHHVVLEDGRWHCFAQFGSGTFVPGVKTHISREMLWSPQHLLGESIVLQRKGVTDALQRLSIHPDAYIVTPWHAMLRRMEETARAAGRQGSCGMGVGEAARAREANWEGGLLARDLLQPQVIAAKLEQHWKAASDRARQILLAHPTAAVRRVYDDYQTFSCARVAAIYRHCTDKLGSSIGRNNLAPVPEQAFLVIGLGLGDEGKGSLVDYLARSQARGLILESAQGVQLDRTYGPYPYVTKTDTTVNSALPFLQRNASRVQEITRIGVLRAYATRHGAGPFVTGSARLTARLPEAHNGANEWQGGFRAGHFDLPAARYACAVSGGLDFLAITCMDRLAALPGVAICTAYEYCGPDTGELDEFFDWERNAGTVLLHSIKVPAEKPSKERQSRLAELLSLCRPGVLKKFKRRERRFAGSAPAAAEQGFLSWLESDAGLGQPIGLVSFGPTCKDKIPLNTRVFN